ncbi:outer membrane protein OmpA-like peptidoglycan-associated protein [Chryseobacterium ginsenosidimutans]|uniref:OmpA family protein n=1 Tax=Chryseobacterium ginsenosidimutans TaxID=687846 RepID=UPI0021692D3B|nr:OmpA family protein [Chryseobacterium ginsenosidimutans]MCS3870941.1 outer membrane protein OmpA-like peptidoglycan-associated protein [Chryseobacterium ginsenosidimutans]
MGKGVNKIDIATNEVNAKVLSRSGNRICVEAGKLIWFKVSEWMSGTTEVDKKKGTIWIRQDYKRELIINKKEIGSGQVYGYAFKKKECGASAYYYIEATLFGNRDTKNITGLYVKGFAPALLVSSKWCLQNDGTDQRDRKFSFGENVFLGLETEGLNQQTLTIEVYRLNNEVTFGKVAGRVFDSNYDPTKDDEQTKVFQKQAKVIDGEVNTEFTIQPSWKKGTDDNLFYVKVKDGNNYVQDSKKQIIHGRYLKVKNNIVPIKQNMVTLTNNAPVKVGAADKDVKVNHLCTFKQINIEDNGETFEVFKEGKTTFEKTSPVVQYTTAKVHFDYDKSEIRSEARDTLKYLLDFLLYNQHLDMTLSGHADDRGTLDYNQALSERRAQAVKDFFAKGGLDKNRIKTRGYGEVNPVASGKTEEAYKKNRRVEIEFSYLEYNQKALFYEMIAPDANKMKEITVNVLNRSDKGCFRKEKHNKNIIYINETGGPGVIPKNGNSLKQIVFSQQAAFPKNYAFLLGKFLNPFSTIYYQFAFHINSCAYYADKDKATLEVRVYPDVVWIGHFQYNGKETVMPYYFHQKNFGLEQGISDVLNELKETTFYKIYRLIPANFIVEHTLLKYIESQAKSYFYGIHTFHNRTVEKAGQELSLSGTQTNLIKQTQYTRFAAAAVIYGFVVVGIIIDLLMIYLTRGRNISTKLEKFAKMARKAESILKKMDDAGVDLIPPAIAVNAGMYYQKQKNGKLALVYEANIKADPLVAVNFKREFDLIKLITKTISGIKGAKHPKETEKKLKENRENSSKIEQYFEKLGTSVKGEISVRGDIMFEQNIKYNFLTNSYSFTDKLGNLVASAQNESIIKEQISFEAKIQGEFKLMFKFNPLQAKVEGKIDIELNGGVGVKLKYGVNVREGKGLFIEKILYCSGIEGKYKGSLIGTSIFGTSKIETNDGKPTPFTLVEPFEVKLYEIQLFKS